MALGLLSSPRARDERVETRVLSKGQVGSADPGRGLEVHCVSGSIWVTAGPEDVVLESGERKAFGGPLRVVFEALSPAKIELSSRG